MAAREAASFLAREFSRLEEAVVPGLRVKDLLTPHFMRERMRRPINEQRLSSVVEGMGYQVEQLPQRGYLLRHDNAPVGGVGLVHRRMAADRGAPQPGQPSLRGVTPKVGGRADTDMAEPVPAA